MKRILLLLLVWVGSAHASLINDLVLEQVRSMPSGGKYAVGTTAFQRLRSAIALTPGDMVAVNASRAVPSFCSGATYLVFLKTIEKLQEHGALTLARNSLEALKVNAQRDGEGVWGRWNANGPGTARLFHELSLGPSFEDYNRAIPGDFMKIFWSSEIGKFERGHLVIYLGTETLSGVEHVRFWSSNIPAGYGTKSVPKSKVARAIFSRLQNPQNLELISSIPESDRFLAEMLTRSATITEVRLKCGIRQRP